MIITNYNLLSEIWSMSNQPKNELDDEYQYYNNYPEIDLNNEKIRDYLKRNVKYLNINLKKLGNDGYQQLQILTQICSNLNNLTFRSFEDIKILDNNYINLLLSQNNIKSIAFNMHIIIDCNYLLNNINKLSDGRKITIYSLENQMLEIKYLKMPLDIRKKINVTRFSNDIYKRIFDCQNNKMVDIDLYWKYKDFFDNISEFDIAINNISELTLEELEILKKDNRIKKIFIKCGYNSIDSKDDNFYSLLEYENILKEVKGIISEIYIPSSNNINREKIIFGQLYKILGERIEYDHYAISDEGRKDIKLSVDCRNLRNGLLGINRNGERKYICVCAGYATILQNISSVLGIKCDYICSFSKEVIEHGVTKFGNYKRIYENGTSDPKGHAYNSVELDGQLYFCDLTWDNRMLKVSSTGTNFLKSYDDFYKNHYSNGFSLDNVEIITMSGDKKFKFDKNKYFKTLPQKEVNQLLLTPVERQLEERKKEDYLCCFVEEYISFIKSCKGKVEKQDLYTILMKVNSIENYILSEKFKTEGKAYDTKLTVSASVWTGKEFQKKNIAFYNSTTGNVEKTIESVERMVGHGR